MPLWTPYQSFNQAIQALPVEGKPEDTYSIPDVYGKAIQFYLALEDSYNNRYYDTDEVALWRGLIALLALKDYLALPLDWAKVVLPSRSNAFCNVLQFTPESLSAFSPTQNAQWDGSCFYVLTWGEQPEDLLLYSPATLVFPVADWRSVLSKIPGIPCFNYAARRFDDPAVVLEKPEKKIVYFWLQEMDQIFKQGNNNSVQATIRHHLDRYISDLGVSLSQQEADCMELKPFSKNDGLSNAVQNLDRTVEAILQFGTDRIPAKQFFSEQLCCFETRAASPFKNCSDSQKYKIQNKADWYALLPFHFRFREYITPQLVGGLDMTWVDRGDGPYIRVTMKIPSSMNAGMDLIKEYKVLDGGAVQEDLPLEGAVLLKDVAVKCPSSSGELPLIAVWPGTLCDAWKEYYVLLEDPYTVGTTLEVYSQESDTGGNKYAIKVKYLPSAIPIERVRGDRRLSVGMVTPQISQAHPVNTATISADVAVDFGTSSTRVFAKIQGLNNKVEIKIADDESFVVTGDGNSGCRSTIRSNFVPSEPFSGDSPNDEGLFSIYKRSTPKFLTDAQPVLDGLIYRAEVDENVESFKCFMPDLKWSVKHNQTYLAAFIKQLCLHVMVILYQNYYVSDITWHYSMPESLDKPSKKIITDIWMNQVQSYLREVSDKIENHVIECYMTESEAASRYFLFDEVGLANDEKGFLVVDIGGGSTDIALWQKTTQGKVMKWHTSVGVAGRMMFTRWIKKHLRNLVGQTSDKQLAGMTDAVVSSPMSEEVQTALAERILGSFSSALIEKYTEERKQHVSGWGTELCAQINQAISLLMFALGCQIGQMIFSKELSVPGGAGSFVIAIGGTGSKILDWTLCSHEVKEYFFRMGTAFANGCIQSVIELQRSKYPKCEVARGLLETTAHVSDRSVTEVERPGLDYQKAVREFEKAYNGKFGGNSDTNSPVLPKLKINKSHVANELRKYSGKQGDIVKVFMECIYKCICMEYDEISKSALDGVGKEDA